ncbi:MAG: hypothetical protein J0L52_04895 [Caulobacterales bacterium]|nr:hypothetical protein [Caulobacterales bacterium]
MFDFGKDLKRFVASGVGGQTRDPRVLELLPTAMVAEQAASEAPLAGQSSQPWRAWRDVALIWVGHARRTGLTSSLEAAGRAADQALAAATAGHAFAFASTVAAEALVARFDLRGDLEALDEADAAVEAAAAEPHARRAEPAVAAIHARIRARRALMDNDPASVRAAAALLDTALHLDSRRGTDPDPWRLVRVVDLRMDRAELSLQAGLRWHDERLLDQAGRDLRVLMDHVDGDVLPITRARAIRACGLALSALGHMAGRTEAMEQAIELMALGRDLFDADHSPLDAAALLAAQAETLLRWQQAAPVTQLLKSAEDLLTQAWKLCATRSTGLEVEIRLRAGRVKTLLAYADGDVAALSGQEARLRQRLARGGTDPVSWAVDQLCLARVYEALDELGCAPGRSWAAAYARAEATETLRESGLGAVV